MSSLGEKVAQLRRERGWTLKQLSEYSGVSFSHIHAIENNTRPSPSFQRVAKLARAFGVPIAFFDNPETTSSPAGSTPSEAEALGLQLQDRYDRETQRFLAAEEAKPYIQLALKLARDDRAEDPSRLLQVIAQFIHDSHSHYSDK